MQTIKTTLALTALLPLLACAGTKAPSPEAPILPAPSAAPAPSAESPPPFKVTVQGSGPHLILIPGLSNGGETLAGIASTYEDRYTVHTLTLAGFAGTPPLPGEAFLPVVKEGVIAYIKDLDSVTLMGHSLGAALSYWVASDAPEAVDAVIAIDGLPYLSDLMSPGITPEAALGAATAMKTQMSSLDADAFCAQTRYALSTMITAPEDQEAVAALACQSQAKASAQAVFELMTTDLRPDIAKITAPLLLLGAGAFAPGEEAKAQLHARYEAQVAAAPTHQVVIIDGARHYIFLDQPEAFYAQVDAFLKEVAR